MVAVSSWFFPQKLEKNQDKNFSLKYPRLLHKYLSGEAVIKISWGYKHL